MEMKSHNNTPQLPDVSLDLKPQFYSRLSQVGMRDIQMPVRIAIEGRDILMPAKVAALVSLDDPEAKGIHMSRLYLEVRDVLEKNTINVNVIKNILQQFLNSHRSLSETATLEIHCELPLKREALVSELSGYRQYPIVLKGQLNSSNEFHFYLETEILYSSTCPCSAALARELIREEFRHRFADKTEFTAKEIEGWLTSNDIGLAVPHAQRSLGRIKVKLDAAALATTKYATGLDFVREHIDALEKAVGTPVQAAVKRVDEQEFARLNGENLMFCEDAARKLRSALEANSDICDYDIYVEHQESLHPHNAVSRVVKGVAGGFGV
jgi:GTP cyclohydrolase IB